MTMPDHDKLPSSLGSGKESKTPSLDNVDPREIAIKDASSPYRNKIIAHEALALASRGVEFPSLIDTESNRESRKARKKLKEESVEGALVLLGASQAERVSGAVIEKTRRNLEQLGHSFSPEGNASHIREIREKIRVIEEWAASIYDHPELIDQMSDEIRRLAKEKLPDLDIEELGKQIGEDTPSSLARVCADIEIEEVKYYKETTEDLANDKKVYEEFIDMVEQDPLFVVKHMGSGDASQIASDIFIADIKDSGRSLGDIIYNRLIHHIEKLNIDANTVLGSINSGVVALVKQAVREVIAQHEASLSSAIGFVEKYKQV